MGVGTEFAESSGIEPKINVEVRRRGRPFGRLRAGSAVHDNFEQSQGAGAEAPDYGIGYGTNKFVP